MSKILVLGGCGFAGSYIIRRLLADGHQVTAVDNFSKYGRIEHDFYKHKNFKLIVKDVRDMRSREFRGYDHVICAAALIGGIIYLHRTPYRITRDNTEVLTYAIDATLAASPKAVFHFISSSMIYGRSQRPVSEKDTANQIIPPNHYGMQKLFGEFLVRSAHDQHGLNYMIERLFNVVGSGELPEVKSKGELDFGMAHVVPDFIHKALLRQSPFEIIGDGEQVRTFTHAKDMADAFGLIIKKGIKNDDINICGSATVSMNELARMIWKTVNGGVPFPKVKHLPAPDDDARYRVAVTTKAKKLLGWEPSYNLHYMIDDSYEFIRQNMSSVRNRA